MDGDDTEDNQPNNGANCDRSEDKLNSVSEPVEDGQKVKSEGTLSEECEENPTVLLEENVKPSQNEMVSMMRSIKIASPAGAGISCLDPSPLAKDDERKQNTCKNTCDRGKKIGLRTKMNPKLFAKSCLSTYPKAH